MNTTLNQQTLDEIDKIMLAARQRAKEKEQKENHLLWLIALPLALLFIVTGLYGLYLQYGV